MSILLLAPSPAAIALTVHAAGDERSDAPESPAQTRDRSTNFVKRASLQHVAEDRKFVEEICDLPNLVHPRECVADWFELYCKGRDADKTSSPENHCEYLEWDDDASLVERVIASILCNE